MNHNVTSVKPHGELTASNEF